jgi:hypothetical protein
MSGKLEFKLIVTENGEEVLSKLLSYEAVSNIVSNASDNKDNEDLFTLAASHPASTVRENVAYKDHMPETAVKILSADKSIGVLRNLVRSQKFKEHATLDMLERLLALDIEIAQSIAGDIESYSDADSAKLAGIVATHSDPSVVASLAGSYSTPKKVLKTLLNHADPYVVSEAKGRLED